MFFFTFYFTNAKSETVNGYSYWNSLLFSKMSGNLSNDKWQRVKKQLRSEPSKHHSIYSPFTREIKGKIRDTEKQKSARNVTNINELMITQHRHRC